LTEHDHPTGGRPAPLTYAQLAEFNRPADAQIAPDGERIAYVMRSASKDDEHPRQAVWLVPFAGGEPRQFTSGLWEDKTPRWSPDSARLAVLSDRAERGKSSVYVMLVDGGEAVRVFDQQGDMAGLAWSPDGNYLAVLYTEPETDDEKKRKEERDDAHVWDADYKFQRLWVIDLEARSARAVSPLGRQVHAFAWAPDSARLAICATHTPNIDDIFRETELAIVSRVGDALETIALQTGVTQDLVWRPDGAQLAYLGPAARVVHSEYVYSVPAAGGPKTCLTPGMPASGDALARLGDALLLTVTEGVNSNLYRLSWSGERTQLLGREPWGALEGGVTVSANGRRFAMIWDDPANVPDVWTVDLDADAQLTRRTHCNPALEAAALGQTEIVRWTSDEGVEVEGILIKPSGYEAGQRYPFVVQVHGGPTWQWSNGFYGNWHDWAQMLAGRGYAVLLPNPRGSTGRGPDYSNAIFGDVGGGEFRDMLAGVDAMIARGIADPDGLGIGGWSWGGYMTAWAVSQPTRFKAAVMGAGLPNMISDNSIGDIPSANLSYFEQTAYEDPDSYYDRSAIKHIRNASTPTLILHGEADKRVNMWQSVEMYMALKTLGVPTQLVTYPREPHGIQERKHQIDLMRRVVEWYDRYLQPERGPEPEPAQAQDGATVGD
jgi:dipeptidyl aminopeptidase/acylaminoacyl peptidase